MTACQERVETWESSEMDILRGVINSFIKNLVSKVIDLRINTVTDNVCEKTMHYAYLRYIPQ